MRFLRSLGQFGHIFIGEMRMRRTFKMKETVFYVIKAALWCHIILYKEIIYHASTRFPQGRCLFEAFWNENNSILYYKITLKSSNFIQRNYIFSLINLLGSEHKLIFGNWFRLRDAWDMEIVLLPAWTILDYLVILRSVKTHIFKVNLQSI